jgi:hypothetical protein
MKIFPTTSDERWHLLLFLFKAYVLIAPICFLVWDLATSERRFRGAREEAMGIVAMGYGICFLIFVIMGLFFCFLRKIDFAADAFLFGILVFLFPMLTYNNVGMLVITASVFILGMKFAQDRHLFTPLVHENEEGFECLVCQTPISSSLQKCPHCGWTYLNTSST